MKSLRKFLLPLAVGAILATPALAADLVLTVGSDGQATLTNKLAQSVYVMYLNTSDAQFGLAQPLAAGQSSNLRVNFAGAPTGTVWADGFELSHQPLAGHTPNSNGTYELSVLVQ